MKYRIFPLSHDSLTIDFGNVISVALNDRAIRLAEKIAKDNPRWLKELVPAYSSLTIFYDLIEVRKTFPKFGSAFLAVKTYLETIARDTTVKTSSRSDLIEIPICYDLEFAPDLENISKIKKIDIEKIVAIHSANIYRVFMLGFLPGFAYMGEVDKKIAMPRLENPRTQVAKGSVGIAGSQTGIYPLDSPGGWQIIGRTPYDMFRPDTDSLTLLKSGDSVKFYPITRQEFVKLAK